MHNVGQCDDTAQTQENDAVPSPKRHLHAVDATCQLGLWQKLRWVGGMMHENGAWLNASSAFKYPFFNLHGLLLANKVESGFVCCTPRGAVFKIPDPRSASVSFEVEWLL